MTYQRHFLLDRSFWTGPYPLSPGKHLNPKPFVTGQASITSTPHSVIRVCTRARLGALALGGSDGGLGGSDKGGNSKAVNAVHVEWESLADDLILEDWHHVHVSALVRETSGYYSDDFEAEAD